MKYLFAAILLLCIATSTVYAQQKTKAQHLMVSVYEYFDSEGEMYITKDDGTQEVRKLNFKCGIAYGKEKNILPYEDSVMGMLKTFFNQGWKLTAIAPYMLTSNSTTGSMVTKYFFVKEGQ